MKTIFFNTHQDPKQGFQRLGSINIFLTSLNFSVMKQLILSMLVTGMVATSALAQNAVKGSDPIPVNCSDDPLNPIAGKPYDYSAILNPTGGTTYWYATKSTTFVTAGARTAV